MKKIIYAAILDMETLAWLPELEISCLYDGPWDKMCGPSEDEKGIEASQESFAATLRANYATTFAKQQATLDTLNDQLKPIIAAGPNASAWATPGGAAEEAALTTEAINTTAANAANARRAVAGAEAGKGASSGISTGIEKQINAAIASSAAGQVGSEELGITKTGFDLGRQQYNMALGGEQALAGAYGGTSGGLMGGASATTESAFKMANTINQESNQAVADIAGGVAGLAGGIAGGIGNLDFTGGSTGKEQLGNFFTGFGA